MSKKGDGNQNPQNAKVLQLGFNISVSGDPDADFEIVLDDKEQGVRRKLFEEGCQSSGLPQLQDSSTIPPNSEVDSSETSENKSREFSENTNEKNHLPKMSENEKNPSTSHKELNIIKEIQSTMEHFEKFSDHIKEIPRLKSHPIATSTPFSDKQNSKSETSLIHAEYRPRKFTHLYDFHSKRDYFRGSVRPPDLFLKPLPGENLYMRGMASRYLDLEPYRHYGSVESLSKSNSNRSKYDVDKYELQSVEPLHGILKKSDSESGDKQSTSSADSVKDIKIYQSGGILIMQNFKEDGFDKKEMSEFSAKLIENCNKLKEEVNSGFPVVDEKVFGNFSEEFRNSGKMVQFDLPEVDSRKSRSADSSGAKDDSLSGKMESSGSTSDCLKIKDNSPQGTSQSQEFPSISTQENDSIVSNQPITSPTNGTISKKLEWDSGADVGYLNLDLSKENLSTIERIVLKGLSSDGQSEKKVVFEKKKDVNHTNRSKFILERMPSDAVMGETSEVATANGKKKAEEADLEKEREKVSSMETPKDVKTSTSEEFQSSKEKLSESTARIEDIFRKSVKSTDKSVNVNTLFENSGNKIVKSGDYRLIESPPKHKPTAKLSPKVKKLKKRKPPSQRPNSIVPLKEKIDSIVENSGKTISSEMGIPKRVYRKVEANPELNEVELSREVEEIIIDQRFKIKQNTSAGRSTPTTATTTTTKSAVVKDVKEKKEVKEKNGVKSASSSSNNTVLPSAVEASKPEESKFVHQNVQTNQFEVESVGIQAFSSQQSSDGELKIFAKKEPVVFAKTSKTEGTSSKNVQAFGLNSSLPKQLENLRESKQIENQNTKSTQFFGGPINSLPNYHSSLITKSAETCGRMPKVLKAKKNLEAEIIRLKEKNEKNIKANEESNHGAEFEKEEKRSNVEDKENIVEKISNGRRSRSNGSRKNSNGGRSQDSNKKSQAKETDLNSAEFSEKKILTSEVLKKHGDSIDRNIIQEKYFQSQLIEIEKREMLEKSTSMERQSEKEKRCVTVGCQYSPQSKGNDSSGETKSRSSGSEKKNEKRDTSEQYDLSQNLIEDERFGTLKSTNQEQEFGTGDSLPSSTQTAHSWVPGMQDSSQNVSGGVGKARSFEYLPGHIYESSGNLREELPSDTEQNMMTSSSSGTSGFKPLDSEGRSTLVLENSTESSYNSGPIKILGDNLTQLNLVVAKLWEKDAQIQSVTQSLLVNLWKKNGSGDNVHQFIGATSSPKREAAIDNQKALMGTDVKSSGDATPEISPAKKKGNEVSIGCQTEKSPPSEPEKLYEERKALEKRISKEKESQIKWIENEIYHLNILRGLLEKQNNSNQRKKRNSMLSICSSDLEKSEEIRERNVTAEVHPRPITPVYGCTISLLDGKRGEENRPISREGVSSCQSNNNPSLSSSVRYGMAVSFPGACATLKKVATLPVGIQVKMKDNQDERDNSLNGSNSSSKSPSPKPILSNNSTNSRKSSQNQRVSHINVDTQFPSIRGSLNLPSTSAQTDFPFLLKCSNCLQKNCVCLNLSDKSNESDSKSLKSRKDTPRLSFADNEGNDATDAEMMEIDTYPPPKNDSSTMKSRGTRSESAGSSSKSKSIHTPRCKCGKCPKKVISVATQPGINCRGLCQSNIYLNCEKTNESFATCRCSKVHVQKSPNCTCHVINIHGAKCCTPENVACFCRRRSSLKKTENQSCQTEEILIVMKDVAENANVVKPVKAPGVVCPSETKIAMESRTSVNEKIPCVPKVCYEKLRPSCAEVEIEEKSELEKNASECSVDVKSPVAVAACMCSKKNQKKNDDHPRHYFLKIEETEIDEMNESVERRKSLEVITVTVPVKKAGKAKTYGPKYQQSRQSDPCSVDSLQDLPGGGCKCCETCIGRICQKVTEHYEFRGKAEKPLSPKRPVSRHPPTPIDCESAEDINAYDYNYRHRNGRSSSSQDKNNSEYLQSESYDSSKSRILCDCGCSKKEVEISPQREICSEYDSHKKKKNQANVNRRCENGKTRYDEDENRFQMDSRLVEPCKSRKSKMDCTRFDSDYYNYNKREFMTKSELLREKENRRRRVHQPTLQECLATNRPDFYTSAEYRRQIISERTRERMKRHNNRMECLLSLIHQCNEREHERNGNSASRRIFTTSQMREQTMRRYKNLPEVTGKRADLKKKEEYRTNKLMADVFAKKLQQEALKGICQRNLENL